MKRQPPTPAADLRKQLTQAARRYEQTKAKRRQLLKRLVELSRQCREARHNLDLLISAAVTDESVSPLDVFRTE